MKLKGIGLFAMGTLSGLEGIMVGDGNNDTSYAGDTGTVTFFGG
jgi:hypothetical protein